MDLRHLRYFVTVAEELNFTKAAERLHTVQPSLSQQIKRLEAMVGVPLFHRWKHRVTLTEAGRVFLEDAQRMLNDAERAFARARQAARAESGAMSIGFIPGAEMKVFPRILPLLRAAFPDLELSLRSLTSPQQLEALNSRQINLGFLRGPIPSPEIASTVLIRERIVAVLPAEHKLARLKKIPIERFEGCKFLGVSHDVAPELHDLTFSILEKAGVHCECVMASENVLTSVGGAASGMGFALLPDYIDQILPRGLVTRPLDLPDPPTIDLLVAYRRDDRLPALTCLLDLLQERILEGPATGLRNPAEGSSPLAITPPDPPRTNPDAVLPP